MNRTDTLTTCVMKYRVGVWQKRQVVVKVPSGCLAETSGSGQSTEWVPGRNVR